MTFGHQKGDDMLCCVADALRRYFPDERVYRIGGDEFVVTSTKLSKQMVELMVNKVRRDLLKENYEISVGIETDACFSAAMRLYVERFVKCEYYDRFDDILDYDKLDKKLSETEAVQFTFQKKNDVWMNVRILEVDRQQNAKPETIWIFVEETH